jgi:hypothetical protein
MTVTAKSRRTHPTKLKGETVTIERAVPKEEVKSLMAALQETLKQLEKK